MEPRQLVEVVERIFVLLLPGGPRHCSVSYHVGTQPALFRRHALTEVARKCTRVCPPTQPCRRLNTANPSASWLGGTKEVPDPSRVSGADVAGPQFAP